jgi:ankyrin repeat protein
VPGGQYTTLIYAAFFQFQDTVDLLIERGVDLDLADVNGNTALLWALRKQNEEIAI